jgi:hypothetical protein
MSLHQAGRISAVETDPKPRIPGILAVWYSSQTGLKVVVDAARLVDPLPSATTRSGHPITCAFLSLSLSHTQTQTQTHILTPQKVFYCLSFARSSINPFARSQDFIAKVGRFLNRSQEAPVQGSNKPGHSVSRKATFNLALSRSLHHFTQSGIFATASKGWMFSPFTHFPTPDYKSPPNPLAWTFLVSCDH